MAAEKHKDCKYFDRINPDKGYCMRYPPIAKNDGREEYIIVPDNGKACGEFAVEG